MIIKDHKSVKKMNYLSKHAHYSVGLTLHVNVSFLYITASNLKTIENRIALKKKMGPQNI